jgi:hypothetical protein
VTGQGAPMCHASGMGPVGHFMLFAKSWPATIAWIFFYRNPLFD